MIHQAVHGYRDGHQLLASSTTLPNAAQRLMLLLSDMSGPSMQPGFETYLTGYPLPYFPAYVLARTWYADDMNRPGCVWTHSLIIANPDLAGIADLGALELLLRRPTPDVRGPLAPVTLPPRPRIDRSAQPLAPAVLAALYGEPAKPAVVLGEQSSALDELALDLVSQQWPRLRRDFSFCTGSLSSRAGSGISFDLHHVPRTLWATVRRDLPDAVVVNEQSAAFVNAAWIARASDDLRQPSPLREFLWAYGADASQGRADFRPLVEVHLGWGQYESTGGAAALVDCIANALPDATVGQRLKADLTAIGSSNRAKSAEVRGALVKAVATTEKHAAFEGSFAPDAFAEMLWRDSREQAIDVLLALTELRLNPLGQRMVSALASRADVEAAVFLAGRRTSILPALVGANLDLASSPAVWRAAGSRKRELLDVLLEPTAAGQIERCVPAILRAGADDLAVPLVDALGDRAVANILDAVDTSEPALVVGGAWQQCIARRPQAVLDWIARSARPRAAALALATSSLDPNASIVATTSATSWRAVAPADATELGPRDRLRLASFLLAIGLGRKGEDAAALIGQTFERVYDAAAELSLDYDTWRFLRGHAPAVWPWRDWDWCERLVHALVRGCVAGDWTVATLLDAARSERAFGQILDVGASFSNRATLRRLRNAVRTGQMQATALQARLLDAASLG